MYIICRNYLDLFLKNNPIGNTKKSAYTPNKKPIIGIIIIKATRRCLLFTGMV